MDDFPQFPNSENDTVDEGNTDIPATIDINFVRNLIPIYSLFIVFLGLPGNIFSCYFFSRKSDVKTFARLIFLCIAISDSIVVVTVPLNRFLKLKFDMDFISLNQASCRLFSLIINMCPIISLILLESLAVERFLAVLFPLKIKSICSKTTRLLMLVLWSAYILIISCIYLFTDRVSWIEVKYCAAPVSKLSFLLVQNHTAFSLQCLAVLITVNAIILIVLSRRSHGRDSRISTRAEQTVKLMIGLSGISILLISPGTLFALLVSTSGPLHGSMNGLQVVTLHDLMFCILETNYGINFYFYCISSKPYRQLFIYTVTCGRYGNKIITSSEASKQRRVSSRVVTDTPNNRESKF